MLSKFEDPSISCTTGVSNATQKIVAKIRTALRDTPGAKQNIGVHILHTILRVLAKTGKSAIRSTIVKIEEDKKAVCCRTWKEVYGGIEL